MPYKFSSGLSTNPSIVEIADFWEVECLKKVDHSASITDIRKAIQIGEDVQEDENDAEETKMEGILDDVSSELHRRIKSCGPNYPYKFDKTGYTLSLNEDVSESYKWLYLFFLCATRHKMGAKRIINAIDGTLLFEKVSKGILVKYFGANSEGYVFGTANRSDGFHNKLIELSKKFGEGFIKDPANLTYNPQDDKLDIAAWISFLDGQPSQVICFGQCKTGTSWQDKLEQLRSDSFVRKWFSDTPALTPIDAFLIADIVDKRDFYHRSVNRLFFDRCRLMNYAQEISTEAFYDDLVNWTKGVFSLYKYKEPVF